MAIRDAPAKEQRLVAEAILAFLLCIGLLSLTDVNWRTRLGVIVYAIVSAMGLVVARLTFIGWLSGADRDLVEPMALFTRWLLPPLDLIGLLLYYRGSFRFHRIRRYLLYPDPSSHALPSDAPADPTLPRQAGSPGRRPFPFHLAGLDVTIVASYVALACAVPSTHAQPPLRLPDTLNAWRGVVTDPLPGDGERGNPPALYRMYRSGVQPPLVVSLARATSLDAMRAPKHYLLDADAWIAPRQTTTLVRTGETTPARLLEIAQGRSKQIMLIHWAQGPETPPVPYALNAPSAAAAALVLHRPFYICDIWTELTTYRVADETKARLILCADSLDAALRRQMR